MPDDTRPKKIKVEVEVDDREVELHIDPETGNVRIENEFGSSEDDSDDEDDEWEEESGSSRGFGLVLGVLLGLAAGAVAGVALVRELSKPAPEGPQAAQDGQESPSGDAFALLGARWREATHEARIATEEAAQRQLARYRELTELESDPPATS